MNEKEGRIVAKITKRGDWGMPKDDVSVPEGITIECNQKQQEVPNAHGCGAVFKTEGGDEYEELLTRYYDQQLVGWVIKCPQCGNVLQVYHPQVKAPEPAKPKSDSCFVATCCFGDLNAPEVVSLRRWRDEKLISSTTGRRFVAWYYSGYSSRAADFISGKPVLRRLGRIALGAFIRLAVK